MAESLVLAFTNIAFILTERNDSAREGIRVKCETVIYSKLQTKMFLNNNSRKMQIKANLLMYGNVGGGNYAAITTLFIGSTVCIICPYTEYILYLYIYFIPATR